LSQTDKISAAYVTAEMYTLANARRRDYLVDVT